jgi:hypothetical protein
MKHLLVLLVLFSLGAPGFSQYVYTIRADSVKLTNCDSSELIVENHTQNVPGFLFNTGNGRTVFKRAAQKLNDSLYLIGADTVKVASNAWVQGRNAFGATGTLGTKDNNHLDFYTADTQRVRLTNRGNLLLNQQLQVGNFTVGNTLASSGANIVTQGQVRAHGGFNLRDPALNDNLFTGMMPDAGIGIVFTISSPVMKMNTIGSLSSGNQISIISGFNPTSGNGTVNVVDFTGSNITMPSGSNSITYNYLNLSPNLIDQAGFGTGTIRGIYINPNFVNAADWRAIETVKGDNRLNSQSGNTGIGLNAAPSSKLDVQGVQGYSQLRLRKQYTPSSTSDTNGQQGDTAVDDNYFYYKTSTGWKRIALSTF